MNPYKLTSRYFIIKMANVKGKEMILKTVRGKQRVS